MFTATKPEILSLFVTVLFWQPGSVTVFTDYFKVVPKPHHSHNIKFIILTNLLGHSFGGKFVPPQETYSFPQHMKAHICNCTH